MIGDLTHSRGGFSELTITYEAAAGDANAQSAALSMRQRRASDVWLMPVTAWTAADIAFEISLDGGTTWNQVDGEDGALVSITSVAADRWHKVPAAAAKLLNVPGVQWRIVSVSNSDGSYVEQAATRTVRVLVGIENL